MFNSHNAHLITRKHASLVDRYGKGEITITQFGYELINFEAAEGRIENRIHDQAIRFTEKPSYPVRSCS